MTWSPPRGTRRAACRVALSVAGGPWQDVRGFDGCAGVLSAEDGTVAVVTQWDDKPKVVIRPPGGAFGPVIALPCGAAWTAGPGVTADAEPATGFDMAVSAGGHTLLAWAALEHRIRASYDGGPAVTVTTARGAGSPRLALRDDGSAVLAFAASGGRVMVAGRLPSGEWTAPARISPRGRGPDDLGATADFEVRLDAALAGDGRAAVAWVSSGRLLAAAGRPGGPWTAAVPLSSPLRATAFYSVRAEPGGGPRIVWSEPEGNLSGFVRGARLVADAQAPPPGLTPPGLSTRLPARAPARAGRVVVRVPVRCSEPCDAILRLTERSETVQAGRLLPAAAGRRSG